jgi:hypothetical protein
MTPPKRPRRDLLPVWTNDDLVDGILRRCGFSDHLIRRAIEVMGEEMDATTPIGEPEWPARGRGVDHVLTVAGLKRVERQQGEVEGGLTVVVKQYVIGSAVTPARPAAAGPSSPSPEIESLPVRSDQPMEIATPHASDDGGEVPTPMPGPVDEAMPADTVRITLKHFVDPGPR